MCSKTTGSTMRLNAGDGRYHTSLWCPHNVYPGDEHIVTGATILCANVSFTIPPSKCCSRLLLSV